MNIDGRIQDEFSNQSILDEYILAGYSQLNFDLFKKVKVQAGLRYEHTDTYVYDQLNGLLLDAREYGNFFPSIFMGYKINDFNNLNLSSVKEYQDLLLLIWLHFSFYRFEYSGFW